MQIGYLVSHLDQLANVGIKLLGIDSPGLEVPGGRELLNAIPLRVLAFEGEAGQF